MVKIVSKKLYGREYRYYNGVKLNSLLFQKKFQREFRKLSKIYYIFPIYKDNVTRKYEWIIPCRYGEISEHPLKDNKFVLSFLSYSTTYSQRVIELLGDDLIKHLSLDKGDKYKDIIVFPFYRLDEIGKLVGARRRRRRKLTKEQQKRLNKVLEKARTARRE